MAFIFHSELLKTQFWTFFVQGSQVIFHTIHAQCDPNIPIITMSDTCVIQSFPMVNSFTSMYQMCIILQALHWSPPSLTGWWDIQSMTSPISHLSYLPELHLVNFDLPFDVWRAFSLIHSTLKQHIIMWIKPLCLFANKQEWLLVWAVQLEDDLSCHIRDRKWRGTGSISIIQGVDIHQ